MVQQKKPKISKFVQRKRFNNAQKQKDAGIYLKETTLCLDAKYYETLIINSEDHATESYILFKIKIMLL